MAHIHDKIDFTASVYVVQESKVLLHKHKKLGIWLPPGGHIELEDDPNEAAVREVLEESGLVVELIGNQKLPHAPSDGSKDLTPPMFLNRHHFNDTHEHIDFIYFGKILSGEIRPEEEGGEIAWFDRSTIEENILNLKDAVRSYALAALDYFKSSNEMLQ